MIELKLKEALSAMQLGIKRSDSKLVSGSLKELDEILKSHRSELDPRMVHFLSQRSYEKARMYLEGDSDIPKGRCS